MKIFIVTETSIGPDWETTNIRQAFETKELAEAYTIQEEPNQKLRERYYNIIEKELIFEDLPK